MIKKVLASIGKKIIKFDKYLMNNKKAKLIILGFFCIFLFMTHFFKITSTR